MKVLEMWQVGSWFSFQQKVVVLCHVMQILKKLFWLRRHDDVTNTFMSLTTGWRSIVASLIFVPPAVLEELKQIDR